MLLWIISVVFWIISVCKGYIIGTLLTDHRCIFMYYSAFQMDYRCIVKGCNAFSKDYCSILMDYRCICYGL